MNARLDRIDRALLNDFQRAFPLVARPYAQIAATLGIDESEVLERLARLTERGAVSRVGPVFRPNRIGASTLAAMAVPHERLDEVAARVSARAQVNHNYEREHELNLWFVVTAPDRAAVDTVLAELELECGLDVLELPLEEEFHIDLGFALW